MFLNIFRKMIFPLLLFSSCFSAEVSNSEVSMPPIATTEVPDASAIPPLVSYDPEVANQQKQGHGENLWSMWNKLFFNNFAAAHGVNAMAKPTATVLAVLRASATMTPDMPCHIPLSHVRIEVGGDYSLKQFPLNDGKFLYIVRNNITKKNCCFITTHTNGILFDNTKDNISGNGVEFFPDENTFGSTQIAAYNPSAKKITFYTLDTTNEDGNYSTEEYDTDPAVNRQATEQTTQLTQQLQQLTQEVAAQKAANAQELEKINQKFSFLTTAARYATTGVGIGLIAGWLANEGDRALKQNFIYGLSGAAVSACMTNLIQSQSRTAFLQSPVVSMFRSLPTLLASATTGTLLHGLLPSTMNPATKIGLCSTVGMILPPAFNFITKKVAHYV